MRNKDDYFDIFSSQKHNHQFGKMAPHKAIFFLALIDCIASGFIDSHKFQLIPQLRSKFLDNWERYVGNDESYKPNMFQPLYYSVSAPFYSLNLKDGKTKKVCSSEKIFNETYDSIEIEEELYFYLKEDKSFAARLRIILISSLL